MLSVTDLAVLSLNAMHFLLTGETMFFLYDKFYFTYKSDRFRDHRQMELLFELYIQTGKPLLTSLRFL